MNAFANAIVDNVTTTRTENLGVTYSTSLDPLVDMFFLLGAKRGADYTTIKNIVKPAFDADPELAFRIALYIRDVREGQGERRIFRNILKYLIESKNMNLVYRVIPAILEIGRADDLFTLLDGDDALARAVLDKISVELRSHNGLMAKWCPRKGKIAARIRNYIGLDAKQYRKLLVQTTKVVESQMCANDWKGINYSHVPSVAMTRYSKAFKRHNADGFTEFLNRVKNKQANPETGKVEKINTGAIYPYDVIRNDSATADVMWNELPDYVPAGLSFLPVIDTSASMESKIGNTSLSCMDVATSLGIYLAERNKSVFKDLWVNFSTQPQFYRLNGTTITEKIFNLDRRNWSGSTNIEAAMKLILNLAIENKVPQQDLPDYLLVLSDMEFNSWGNRAPGEQIKRMFAEAGYRAPNIVWWNIQSRNGVVPVRANDWGMALVSGFSPVIVKNLLSGDITPVKIMLNTILKDRYSY